MNIGKELLNNFKIEKVEFEKYIDKDLEITLKNEEWKEIEGFNYSVSNCGRIKNNTTNNIKALRNGLYGFQVNLWNRSNAKMFTISRLVANYFIREVKENERVRHIDQDIRNNYVENLEIVSK